MVILRKVQTCFTGLDFPLPINKHEIVFIVAPLDQTYDEVDPCPNTDTSERDKFKNAKSNLTSHKPIYPEKPKEETQRYEHRLV